MAKAGIPAHVPTDATRAEVAALVAYGIKQEHIASRLRISDETLRKYYQYEIDNGLANMINEVANALYNKGVNQGDTSALIFILKTRGRWTDKDPDENKKFESLVEKLVDKLVEK
jgi:hypothetical protein